MLIEANEMYKIVSKRLVNRACNLYRTVSDSFSRCEVLKGASGEKNSRRGPWWLWPFSLIYGTREREIPGQYFSGGFPRGKRGYRFATPRFSTRRRLAVAGGWVVVLRGWKQEMDIWLYETTLLDDENMLIFELGEPVNNIILGKTSSR